LTIVIALSAVGAFISASAFLPGGPLFDSSFLRVVFSVLACIVAATTIAVGFLAVRLLRDVAAPLPGKIQALLVAMSTVALTSVMFGFWVPVSWRSSDGGIDRLAKRVHDVGSFVDSSEESVGEFRFG
jgi:hypothetical protein